MKNTFFAILAFVVPCSISMYTSIVAMEVEHNFKVYIDNRTARPILVAYSRALNNKELVKKIPARTSLPIEQLTGNMIGRMAIRLEEAPDNSKIKELSSEELSELGQSGRDIVVNESFYDENDISYEIALIEENPAALRLPKFISDAEFISEAEGFVPEKKLSKKGSSMYLESYQIPVEFGLVTKQDDRSVKIILPDNPLPKNSSSTSALFLTKIECNSCEKEPLIAIIPSVARLFPSRLEEPFIKDLQGTRAFILPLYGAWPDTSLYSTSTH